jgi:hypothetical protein
VIDFAALVDGPVMDQFGEPITYHPRQGPGFAASITGKRGIFDRDHELVLTEVAASEMNAAGHSTTGPVLSVRPSELGITPKQADEVTVQGRRYRVWDVRRDGPDWLDLILKDNLP